MKEDELLAILYSNLSSKGKQTKDWIYLAEKLRELKGIYKTDKKVAGILGISQEMVRSTIRLLDLPEAVRAMVRNGRISQDLGWRLLGIKDRKTQLKIANSILGLGAHDARDIIRYTKNNPDQPIDARIEGIRKLKTSIKKLNLIILSFDQEDYDVLRNIAEKERTKPQELVSRLIKDWIKARVKE